MTLIRSAMRAVTELRTTPTSPENPSVGLTSDVLLNWLGANNKNDAGVLVNQATAMSFGPVWRAVALLSGLGGALPLHTYRSGTKDRSPSLLLDDPHPELTPLEFWRLNYAHRLLWGNGFSQKVRDRAGQLRYLYPIRPNRVEPYRVAPTPDNLSGKLFKVTADTGEQLVLSSREILHIPGLGYDGVKGLSPVAAARQAIGMGIAAERYGARLFGSGALMQGILQTKEQLTQTQADELRQKWRDKTAGLDRSHEVPVLDNEATFHQLTMPNDDAQFLESRRFQVTDVARWFGVPPFLLGETERSTSWGTGLEQQAIGFVTFDLHPQWLAPTEQRVTKELVGAGRYSKYAVEGLLRGDSRARAAFYVAMRNLGAYNVDEIRELEDRPPLPDGIGQGYLEPMNMRPLGSDDAMFDDDEEDEDDSRSDPADQ